MTKMKSFFIIALLTLSSCASRNAKMDNAYCAELGFKQGTEAFGNCRLQRDALRVQKMLVITNFKR